MPAVHGRPDLARARRHHHSLWIPLAADDALEDTDTILPRSLARPPASVVFASLGGTMLTIFGRPHARGGFCDGVSRRDFLTIGGAIVGGALALPQLLRAGVDASSHKSIINVYL